MSYPPAKAYKSCTPFAKLNIPKIVEEKDCHYNKHYNITNKASKIYLTKHVQRKINMFVVLGEISGF